MFDENKVMEPELAGMLLTDSKPRIGRKEVAKAGELLKKYKSGKANLEARIVEDELWWELRHWEAIGRKEGTKANEAARKNPKATSAWLFNAITNKHADAMDNYPEPVLLPREPEDEQSAKTLTSVLPVILEQNNFEETYSDNWWEKLKHGTAAYGIFWDTKKENGLGDIDIHVIDLLKLFWEPGITDIQQSKNLFIVDLVDEEELDKMYPDHKGRMGGGTVDVAQYIYDDNVDTTGKSVVVDWYYKVQAPSGKTVLHFAKFVGDELLFASENEPQYQQTGWYEHGMYPVVLDAMYPEKGTPAGFGMVAVCKDPQLYIDDLSGRVLKSAMMQTTPRWFVSEGSAVNHDQLLDWNEPLVQVAGPLDENRLRDFSVDRLDGNVLSVLQMKVEELKETSSNRDVNSGGASGITAAAAIAALQEAGNKGSRDIIAGSYRAMAKIYEICVELMRQFYDESRSFRITGTAGAYEFASINNAALKDQMITNGREELFRKPVFDIKIKAQKKNPFSRAEQNERAKELYQLGFFNPERAQEALGALEMMDFEGIDKVREQAQQGQTLYNMVQQLAQKVAMLTGQMMPQQMGAPAPAQQEVSGGGVDAQMAQAQTPMTGYGESLAKRSAPDMNAANDAVVANGQSGI